MPRRPARRAPPPSSPREQPANLHPTLPIHSSLVTHLPSALKLCLYVMMRRNSSSLTSPSPSMSALLIISCSSSSVMFSPSSRATRLRLRKEILPVSSSSKSLKTRRISSGESRSPILPVIISTNSSKSIVPEPSRSMSAIILRTFSFFESNPSARSATCSSLVSMVPEPSVSKRSKASRSSCICHSGIPGRAVTGARDAALADIGAPRPPGDFL
mmetsp:Transcript_24787/g.62918  ORF Transcript_24787/g.62918 Transcript_24787/m.62918 type:complete len:215 (-) Transcript_24787:56-700(-)